MNLSLVIEGYILDTIRMEIYECYIKAALSVLQRLLSVNVEELVFNIKHQYIASCIYI